MSIIERSIERMRRSAPSAETVKSIGTVTLPVLNAAAVEAAALPDEQPGFEPARQVLIDKDALRDAGYMPETSCARRFADEYRRIKRPLIAAALATPQRGAGSKAIIMMASALPGDGKTFTSINLALSMARERDTSVLLVDADVAKPHVSRIFGAESEPGLLDALSNDSVNIESLVLGTNVKGLYLLPAGKRSENAAELVASSRMGQLMARLQERDPRLLILMDSPPLLATSESRALSQVAGQVVLVVRACKTPRNAVLDALQAISGTPSVNLVLNQGRPSITESYYDVGTYGDEPPAA